MNKNTKLKEIQNLYETKERDNGDKYIVISEKANKDIHNDVKELMFQNDTGNLDLLYRIWGEASDFLAEVELKDIEKDDFDIYENQSDGFASIWNASRLEYLNVNNEYEIMDCLKESGCDSINQACAIWFDREVENAIMALVEYIKE